MVLPASVWTQVCDGYTACLHTPSDLAKLDEIKPVSEKKHLVCGGSLKSCFKGMNMGYHPEAWSAAAGGCLARHVSSSEDCGRYGFITKVDFSCVLFCANGGHTNNFRGLILQGVCPICGLFKLLVSSTQDPGDKPRDFDQVLPESMPRRRSLCSHEGHVFFSHFLALI